MGSFRGKFDHSIDAKGRINIPAKFRKALNPDANDTFVICRAPDECLRAYPLDQWLTYEKELKSRPQNAQTTKLLRKIFGTLSESTLDAQGRINLVPDQLKITGITKDVTLIGQSDFIEIWDTAKYGEYDNQDDDFDSAFYQSIETAGPSGK